VTAMAMLISPAPGPLHPDPITGRIGYWPYGCPGGDQITGHLDLVAALPNALSGDSTVVLDVPETHRPGQSVTVVPGSKTPHPLPISEDGLLAE
jgi:hypothetical protein